LFVGLHQGRVELGLFEEPALGDATSLSTNLKQARIIVEFVELLSGPLFEESKYTEENRDQQGRERSCRRRILTA